MSLPIIDFKRIRLHGTQADAFEELCCQLAADEASPERLRFDRKGRGGDAGVECFETLADGSEIGWQVKFYWDIDAMLRSLGNSLDKALTKHPKMCKFIACFPFDLADARKTDTESALEKWNTWRENRIKVAGDSGRAIEIERWDSHALRQRLTSSNPRAAGRVAFWLNEQLLTLDWFRARFARAKASLGERYDPEGHIDVSIGGAIRAVTGDPALFDELGQLGDAVGRAAAEAFPIAGTPAEGACAAAVSALHAAAQLRTVSVSAMREAVRTAASVVLQLRDELDEASNAEVLSDAMRAVADLVSRLGEVAAVLSQPHWGLLHARSLLVYGAAGTGKSHLLADACAGHLKVGHPALLVLGGSLADAEPWGQILRGLDLPRHLETSQFLGALNAAGEAAGVRALIAIDALNEKNGQAIWPERLTGLLHDIEQFPWISVVLSCRTTYLEVVIPDTLDESKLPRVEHHGFSIAEVRAYLFQCGMTLPETPLQALEFENPLFVRLYRDALDFEGEAVLGRGLGGVSDIFRAYTGAVTRRVHRNLKVALGRNPGEKAVAALAREMAETGRAEVAIDRAEEIVRAIHPGHSIEDSLLFQLENEGLLAGEPMFDLEGHLGQAIRFTFERMGDHAIAADLIMRSDTGNAAAISAPGTPLRAALEADDSRILFGLLEALAIQLPERYGIELPDMAGLPDAVEPEDGFMSSLTARRLDAHSARTWELVDKLGGAALRYDTLIALATEPDHSYNAHFLDAELRALSMPVRDASWSIYLAQSPDAALHLIDWVRLVDPRTLAAKRAELAVTQLTWFLTATHRPLRDRATKALVALLADRPELAREAWRTYSGLDDFYVVERLAAALYGAAMQGRWTEQELRAVTETVHADLFAGGKPPANLLLRDHATGLVGYASQRGVLPPEFDVASAKLPFSSAWPIEHVSEDQLEAFTAAYRDGMRFHDDIYSSLNDGDFARYVLDSVVRRFSPALRGTDPLPTATELKEQWLAEFAAGATEEELAAYATLESGIAAVKGDGPVHAADLDVLRGVKRAFRDVVGSERFEDWRARAENWRDEGMYQSFAPRPQVPASFNLAWARRWVTWRAHDLGWSEALHHAFDRSVRGERNSHEIERLGKKYQWLATYELAARMGDNLSVLPREEETGPSRLRNIDPSMLRERTEDDGWRRRSEASYWAPQRPTIGASTPREALAWLQSEAAILDGLENIEVSSQDERQWLVLAGFEIWEDHRDKVHCESWRRIGCTIVRAADREKLLALLASKHMTGHQDMPVAGADEFHMHLGEHPWAWPDRAGSDGWLEWQPNWEVPGVAVRPPTAEYSSETGGYDYSITQNITLHLPARWLMDALGLRLSDGRSIEYRNAEDKLVFMDPSVARAGRSAALIERTAFLDVLRREKLVAVWAVAGEKSVFGRPLSDGFGGRRVFTRLFVFDGVNVQALPRFETCERPSRHQRSVLLGEAAEDLPEDV